jgi:hypothetical protein
LNSYKFFYLVKILGFKSADELYLPLAQVRPHDKLSLIKGLTVLDQPSGCGEQGTVTKAFLGTEKDIKDSAFW